MSRRMFLGILLLQAAVMGPAAATEVGGAKDLVRHRIVDKVGDVDNFHEGDARDIPRRSVLLAKVISNPEAAGPNSPVELDVDGADRFVGFTHAFDLPPGAIITGATLKLRITSNNSLFSNDVILLDDAISETAAGRPGIPQIALRHLLGFEPVAGQVYDVKIDLSNVPVVTTSSPTQPGEPQPVQPDAFVNLLSNLQDGQLNVIVTDDTEIDFSRLTVRFSAPKGGDLQCRADDDQEDDLDP